VTIWLVFFVANSIQNFELNSNVYSLLMLPVFSSAITTLDFLLFILHEKLAKITSTNVSPQWTPHSELP